MHGPSVCFFNNKNIFVHKGTRLFYKEFLSDTNYYTILALSNGYNPIKKSCYETDIYKDYISNENLGLERDVIALTSQLRDYYYDIEAFPGSDIARDYIGEVTNLIVKDKMSVSEALNIVYENCIRLH